MSSYVPPPYTPVKLKDTAYPCIYDFRRGGDVHHPDWEFFSEVSMTEPFFLKRVERFLSPSSRTPHYTAGKPDYVTYSFTIGQRIWLIKLVVQRYLNCGPLVLSDHQTLQKLARVLADGAAVCLAEMGTNDIKTYLNDLLEVIRLIHVDWIQ